MTKTTDVHEAVRRELAFDPLVDATDITVVNLGGAVALNGVVPSYPQYLEAAAAARRAQASGVWTTTWKWSCPTRPTATTLS